jgi:hypothetical protein
MQLWQMDLMGGVFPAGGRKCKLVTGVDDHSRFIVIAKVVATPSGRAVCTAFAEAMTTYGVPSEVLTDKGKQFTGRFTKPFPAEVLFERICRENGITARLTKPRSPTATGKIERFHKSLWRELLDRVGPFADQETARAAIDACVRGLQPQAPAPGARHGGAGLRVPGPAGWGSVPAWGPHVRFAAGCAGCARRGNTPGLRRSTRPRPRGPSFRVCAGRSSPGVRADVGRGTGAVPGRGPASRVVVRHRRASG